MPTKKKEDNPLRLRVRAGRSFNMWGEGDVAYVEDGPDIRAAMAAGYLVEVDDAGNDKAETRPSDATRDSG